MRPPSLTQVAQQRVSAVLYDGALAVDATVGNGHDTLFLAQQVGPGGHVWGFDIQRDALDAAAARLREHELAGRVTLLRAGHQSLSAELPASAHGRLAAVMFNLGYLPGGDKGTTTLPDTTLAALAAAARELAPGGLLSVLAYRGHAGGQAEADAVAVWLTGLAPDRFRVETIESPGPVLHLVGKASGSGPDNTA